MDELKLELLENLKTNHCNISDALEYLDGVTMHDFYEFMKDEDFQNEYNIAIQIRDDKAAEVFMDLILSGDRAAVIEYQKLKRQSDDADDARRIRKEVMRVLVQLAETKSLCLKEYCTIFNASSKMAEKQYSGVVAEYNLETAYERSKKSKKEQDSMMSTLFDKAKLSEIDMYSRMLSKSLYDSEMSEYPSERSKARADVISINQRLDEINERQRREAESDDVNIIDGFDSLASGSKPEEIQALRAKLAQEAKALTDVNS